MYPLISLTVHPILSEGYLRISRIPTESLGVSINQPDSPSNIVWVILLDQQDTHWIFIGCIYWSAWQSIQYYLEDTFRSAGYTLNIHWMYLLVSLTVHPILSGWYCWHSQIPKKCLLSVSIHKPLLVSLTCNSILSGWYHRISRNIPWQAIQYFWMVLSDQPNTDWTFNWCIYQLFRLTGHPILSGLYCRIGRIPSEYLFSEHDSPSNIMWVVQLD